MSKIKPPFRRTRLIIYGHSASPNALQLADRLNSHQISYAWRDVRNGKPRYRRELMHLTQGTLAVPTVIFPDGEVWVEPFAKEVLQKLAFDRPGFLERLFSRLRGEPASRHF